MKGYFANIVGKFSRGMGVVFLFLFIGGGQGVKAQTYHPDFLDGVIYIKKYDTSSIQLDPYQGNEPNLNGIISQYGVDTIEQTLQNLPDVYRVEFSDVPSTGGLVNDMQQLSYIEKAEKMPLYKGSYVPNDLQSTQWSLPQIDAEKAWDSVLGDSGVTVAIVDNAFYRPHEDLGQNLWVNGDETPGNGLDDDLNGYSDDINGYDVAERDNDPDPPSSSGAWYHGTHVGGISSAVTDNGTGIASLGFNLSLIGVKCSPDSSSGAVLTHAYEGVDYAISADADVINMSFGSSSNVVVGQALIQEAYSNGITLVGAAGNADTTEKFYPAAYNEVIAVGATNENDEKASFSNFGNWIDVMAPGTNIYSTFPDNTSAYGYLGGTSMATPLVSGLAGLVITQNPTFSPSQVKQAIQDGCEDIDGNNPSYQGQLGAGRINAWYSLGGNTFVEEKKLTSPEMRIYPVPSRGRLNIRIPEHPDDRPEEVVLLDMSGKVVRRFSKQLSQYPTEISLGVEKGNYILRVQGRKKEYRSVLPVISAGN